MYNQRCYNEDLIRNYYLNRSHHFVAEPMSANITYTSDEIMNIIIHDSKYYRRY